MRFDRMVDLNDRKVNRRSGLRPETRQNAILSLLKQRGRLTVTELADHFSSSHETIRRDLTALADQNLIRKFHGGAALPQAETESPFSVRMGERALEKQMIARLAASLPQEGDSLFIDTGSTTLAFAEELVNRSRLTVITNAPAIAGRLSRASGFNNVFLLGGKFHPEVDETVGPLCIEQIKRFRTTHAYLTLGALRPEGIMNFDVDETEVARAMLAQAEEVTLLADSSKFTRSALFEVAPLKAARRLVTDAAPPPHLMKALETAGVEVLIAK
jgi:DeoR family glycerol-3-phosphate regulon repressor